MAEEIPWDLLLFVRTNAVVTKVMAKDDAVRMQSDLDSAGHTSLGRGLLAEPAADSNAGASVVEGEDRQLSEAEADAVRRTVLAARARRLHIHLVDIGKESVLRRVIDEHRHRIRDYPVLVRKDGQRLEGAANFTDDRLAQFLGGP